MNPATGSRERHGAGKGGRDIRHNTGHDDCECIRVLLYNASSITVHFWVKILIFSTEIVNKKTCGYFKL